MRHLVEQWLDAKTRETEAVASRRHIEDQMALELGVRPNQEGTQNHEIAGYQIKIVSRFAQKVDSDLVQEIAAEHGLENHLPSLFRWKAEINASNWKAASPQITDVLARAVTTTPSRPSFAITQKESK